MDALCKLFCDRPDDIKLLAIVAVASALVVLVLIVRGR